MAKAKPFDAAKTPFDYGTTEPVSVKSTSGGPFIAKLSDGTVLEIRIVVVDVKRSKDRYDSKGDAVYAVASAPIISAKIPAKFKLKKVK